MEKVRIAGKMRRYINSSLKRNESIGLSPHLTARLNSSRVCLLSTLSNSVLLNTFWRQPLPLSTLARIAWVQFLPLLPFPHESPFPEGLARMQCPGKMVIKEMLQVHSLCQSSTSAHLLIPLVTSTVYNTFCLVL
jgi:hypothetical protein